jgi:two-component system response regulator HupR/HoxA
MTPAARPVFIERTHRKPLSVQVVTRPALRGCWSVNISHSGVGLVARPRGPQDGPREGQKLELEFSLPGAGARIRVTGEVRWRHDGEATPEEVNAALGVSFHSFEGRGELRLARYLLEHEVNVAVAFASEQQAQRVREELETVARPLFAESPAEVELLVGRGDISALVIFGHREQARALVERMGGRGAEESRRWGAQPRDLAPRVILCAALQAEELVELFNAGWIYRSLAVPLEPGALNPVALSACREHGMRTEQQRVALELERNLVRKHAPVENEEMRVEGPGFQSPGMKRVLSLAHIAAPHRVAVLLQGETGTGKEVMARMVHKLSARREAPFVVQDCGALSETLLESELFGHVKGAFTGAVADHPGMFVLADSGTIFLDEIENTTPNFQSKLLRVIEAGDVRAVGGTRVRQVDVRIIAAGNRDLAEEVRQGRFRSDLFYRLNTFTITLPPLRARPEDVIPLAEHFIAAFTVSLGRKVAGLSPEARQALLDAPWPGNVRELRNVMERAVLLTGAGEAIGRAHLPESVTGESAATADPSGAHHSLRAHLEHVERELIRQALTRNDGVMRRAAAELQADPATLGRKARKYGLI